MDEIYISSDTLEDQAVNPSESGAKMRILGRRPVLVDISVLLISAILFGGLALCRSLTNNYLTPIKIEAKYRNIREYSIEKVVIDYSNGLGAGTWKRIFSIAHDSEIYMDYYDELYDELVSGIEQNMDEYGDDYKYSFEVVGKTELTNAELRDYRSEIQDTIELFKDMVEEADEFDSADWSDLADDMDLTKADTKEIFSLLKQLVDEFRRPEVTEGYELEIKGLYTGSELEEPVEEDRTVIVLKVNGRWITLNDFKQVYVVFVLAFYDAFYSNF